jgi:NAD-dependent DNA ligase
MASNSYSCDYAKTARSKCKYSKCKQQIAAKELRLGKSHPSGFGDGDSTDYFHPACLFASFQNARKGTITITSEDDIEGFDDLEAADQKKIQSLISGGGGSAAPTKASPKKKAAPTKKRKADSDEDDDSDSGESPVQKKKKVAPTKKVAAPSKKKASNDYSTWVIAITGTLSRKRDDVIEGIESAGATYSSTVTKKCTHLIVSDPNSNTAKIVKARESGVTILGEDDLPF